MKILNFEKKVLAGCIVAMTGSLLWAANPETDRSAANADNPDATTAERAKGHANRALIGVEDGTHKAGRKVHRGAHKAKVKTQKGMHRADNGMHEAGQDIKEAGQNAGERIDNAVH